jgi:hypothetical protein
MERDYDYDSRIHAADLPTARKGNGRTAGTRAVARAGRA